MLYLILHVDGQRYGLAAHEVVAVLPMIEVKPVVGAPDYVKGWFEYRESSAPLIDFCRLACGRDAVRVMSTRVIVVHYPLANGEQRPLGLIAEGVTETRKIDSADLRPLSFASDAGPLQGGLVEDEHGSIYCIDSRAILPDQLRRYLYAADSSLEVA